MGQDTTSTTSIQAPRSIEDVLIQTPLQLLRCRDPLLRNPLRQICLEDQPRATVLATTFPRSRNQGTELRPLGNIRCWI
ncbi:hypothetical protein Zm00014a_036987 [Zea mays]|uniref:Uncharacterized protein n=1 Tax=Zea mays TaxID=4577 RepID=A0A3L6G075_MAIZE|nr:hypothetical protein Zm00014a_036987 [Zea mays]